MSTESDAPDDYRILMLAPTRRDREAMLDLLQRAKLESTSFDSARSLSIQIDRTAGAVLLTDAAFRDPHISDLLAALSRQPPWSDIPIIFLCAADQSSAAIRMIDLLHNVTALERPSSSRTLLSSIQASLRARARQYQMRDQLALLHKSEAAHQESEQRFRAAIDAMNGVLWTNTANGEMRGEQAGWATLTGQSFGDYQGYGWAKAVHPDDAQPTIDAWNAAVAERRPFVFEHRVKSHDAQWRAYSIRAIPVFSNTGEIREWVGVHTDISERKAAELALRESDKRKDVFLATLAHELRNPLAPIRTIAQMLGSPNLAPHKLQWAQNVIQRQVKHMAWLLDDLLDIARITQGKLVLKKGRVTLTSIVDAAVETARPLIERKSHHLIVTLPPEEIALDADQLRLSQVLSNLLTNAAKYTDAGGHIELIGSVDNGSLYLTVKDSGIGISPDSMGQLFTMFSQVDGGASQSEGGLGIGLALVKGLIELHGGSVGVRSDGLSHGSVFTAHLPLPPLQPLAEGNRGMNTLPLPTTARRVLVADDNQDAADALAMILEIAGHEVRVAHNGRVALSLAQTFRPDVALLDIGMPDMSGYEVARALRREQWGAGIHIIALTGWGQESDRQQARDAGFDCHLTKPVDPDALEAFLFSPRVPSE